MPSHAHALVNGTAKVDVYTTESTSISSETDNGANGLGTGSGMPEIFRETPNAADHLGGVSISGSTNPIGNNQPISSRNPYLGVNVCIALFGIYPSRS